MATRTVPEPAEHVTCVTPVTTVVTPGKPVIKLSEFFVSCEISFLVCFSWEDEGHSEHSSHGY